MEFIAILMSCHSFDAICCILFKGLKNQARVKLNIVRCPPVTTVLIRRPDLRYQLGFSVQNGIVSSILNQFLWHCSFHRPFFVYFRKGIKTGNKLNSKALGFLSNKSRYDILESVDKYGKSSQCWGGQYNPE